MNLDELREITEFNDLYISKDGKLRIGSYIDKASPLYCLEDIQNKLCKTERDKALFIVNYVNRPVKLEKGVTIANILTAIEPWVDYFTAYCNGKNIKSYIDEFNSLDFKKETHKIIYIAKTLSPTLGTSTINDKGEKLSRYQIKKGLQNEADFKEVQDDSIEENEYVHVSVYQNPYDKEERNHMGFSLNDAKNIPVVISNYKYIVTNDSKFIGSRASINYQNQNQNFEIIKVKYDVSLNELIVWIMNYGLFWHDTARYKEIEDEMCKSLLKPIDLSKSISSEELEEEIEERCEKRMAELPENFEPLFPKMLREFLEDLPEAMLKGIEIQNNKDVLLFGEKME